MSSGDGYFAPTPATLISSTSTPLGSQTPIGNAGLTTNHAAPPFEERAVLDHSLEASTAILSVIDTGILKVTNKTASNRSLFHPFSGIISDIRGRAPYYRSDFTDALNYRVLPATALIFFSNILPGIAFSLDLIETTNQYGVCEVLLSSFMGAFVFSIFGAQPLVILGPITVFNKTIYDILKTKSNAPTYLHFIGWVYLWAAVMHWIAAIFNWCNFLRYVTRFSCETFGFFVSWVYLQYGVQVVTRQFHAADAGQIDPDGTLVSLILALIVLVLAHLFNILSQTTLFKRPVRRFLADYGLPITVVAGSALAYWGRFNNSNPLTLPTAGAFQPAQGRHWLVPFWQLEARWVGIALPFGFVLFSLFFFDHNVSSLMAQDSEFPLRKRPGFHWDFFLLGITTFIAGLLGLPAPNGLIPQAPIHTRSLLVMGFPKKDDDLEATTEDKSPPTEGLTEKPIAVVEQRVSNLAQGSLGLVLMSGPFLHLLGLIPRGVLAGLFWFMGSDALLSNGITQKIFYLLRDHHLVDPREPLRAVRQSRIVIFLGCSLLGFAGTMAITQTIAAIGFPIIIVLLIPLRTSVMPHLPFTAEELAILDGPTASPFTMESVGGSI